MRQEEEYLDTIGSITGHYGEEYSHYYDAIVPPVFMNSLHVFETLDDYYDFDRRDKHKYCYGRVQNPTIRILEDKIAALEKGIGALVFSSGMAAATTALLTTCKAGSHIICLHNAYGPLKKFIDSYCVPKLGMSVSYVQGDNIEEFEGVIREETDLIILESPSSIVFHIQDIRGVSQLAKRYNALVYIDNSFATPVFQNPLELGADIVMHTTSKYIGGHSDLIGGALAVKDPQLYEDLINQRELLGGIAGPMEGWLMIRGLRTLEVRLKAHEQTAMAVATFLENHPKVAKVHYSGLASHPQKDLIDKQQRGNSGLLSFEIKGSVEDAKKVVETLQYFKIGVSWGGFESLAFMPHMKLSSKECDTLGAGKNVIRIHCGLEGTDLLIKDLSKALETI